ncbi:hypothetical protein IV203_025836 [Nitzschia inconspicua]|uniref:Uncharacterized protein n=1 Tax=Nitzschia inconspicua TaxID=303405 RepID=A0A9K3K8C8_9STRA|nr:hypothetical protein IV203_017684 [Nitzschia inconspicua]KAG7362170.1 hypothetical protein IV203_025836 [Nitzschia inconspicua]
MTILSCSHRQKRTNDLLTVVARERKRLRIERQYDRSAVANRSLNEIIAMNPSSLFATLQGNPHEIGETTTTMNLSSSSTMAPFVVPTLIQIENGRSADEELHDDESASSTSTSSSRNDSVPFHHQQVTFSLPYKSSERRRPTTSSNDKVVQHWMKVTRPLSVPPRLPTSFEAIKLLSAFKS